MVDFMRFSLEIELLADIARELPAGHRLGVMISATNWPLFGRNPNDGAVFYRGDTASRTQAALVGDGYLVEMEAEAMRGQMTTSTLGFTPPT